MGVCHSDHATLSQMHICNRSTRLFRWTDVGPDTTFLCKAFCSILPFRVYTRKVPMHPSRGILQDAREKKENEKPSGPSTAEHVHKGRRQRTDSAPASCRVTMASSTLSTSEGYAKPFANAKAISKGRMRSGRMYREHPSSLLLMDSS